MRQGAACCIETPAEEWQTAIIAGPTSRSGHGDLADPFGSTFIWTSETMLPRQESA